MTYIKGFNRNQAVLIPEVIINIIGLENLLSVFALFLSFFSYRNIMLPLKKLDITLKQPKFKLIMISHIS
jgi:hypothetical protein